MLDDGRELPQRPSRSGRRASARRSWPRAAGCAPTHSDACHRRDADQHRRPTHRDRSGGRGGTVGRAPADELPGRHLARRPSRQHGAEPHRRLPPSPRVIEHGVRRPVHQPGPRQGRGDRPTGEHRRHRATRLFRRRPLRPPRSSEAALHEHTSRALTREAGKPSSDFWFKGGKDGREAGGGAVPVR